MAYTVRHDIVLNYGDQRVVNIHSLGHYLNRMKLGVSDALAGASVAKPGLTLGGVSDFDVENPYSIGVMLVNCNAVIREKDLDCFDFVVREDKVVMTIRLEGADNLNMVSAVVNCIMRFWPGDVADQEIPYVNLRGANEPITVDDVGILLVELGDYFTLSCGEMHEAIEAGDDAECEAA